MKKTGMKGVWIGLSIIYLLFFCQEIGWPGEWLQISPADFGEAGESARCFQQGMFDPNYLYVITSDLNGFTLIDPNRKTILWASEVKEDLDQWRQERDNLWYEVEWNGDAVRSDKLFPGSGLIYAGLYRDGNCRIYQFSNPDGWKDVAIGQTAGQRTKWHVEAGVEYENAIYVGIYETDYGIRILRGSLPDGPVNQELMIDGIQGDDPEGHIGFLKRAGGRLFIGTRQSSLGAVISYTSDGKEWRRSSRNKFLDPNVSEDIVAFLSLVEFMGEGWLLTQVEKDGQNQWVLWKTSLSSDDAPQWENRMDSWDLNGPFSDPDIAAVTALVPIGEYLYVGCLNNDSGEIWKSYQGEKQEWIRVPSPSELNTQFNPDNLLCDIFYNPFDEDHMDYIFAGTRNDNGAQILARLVPRIDISNLPMENRFLGPHNETIRMKIVPNWMDPNEWMDPGHFPRPSIFSYKDPNRILKSFDPNRIELNDISVLEFDPNIMDGEGLYALRFESTYGQEKERVVKYLTFAWDTNAPSAPSISEVGEGDGHIKITWHASKDSLEQNAGQEDANFSQSIMGYELVYGPKDKSDQDTNIIVRGRCYKDISNLQNYVIYRIRVRALDKANNSSNWSEEVEGTPQPTLGWTDLLNDPGGCFVSALHSEKRRRLWHVGRYFAGLKVGRYEPRASEADVIYGEDKAWPFQVEIGWVHRPYLEVGFSTGYMELDGTAIKILTHEKSIDPAVFRMIPGAMTFRWLFFQNPEKILIPYLGGGINIWWYREEKPRGKKTEGWKYGAHGSCGVRLLLDKFDPKHADFLSTGFGVKNTYLTLDFVYHWIDNFGKSRLDLGGAFYQAGILFLF